MRYLFESKNLIGDALYVGPALRSWLKKAGANSLQDEIYMSTLPDHVAPLYQGMVRDLVNIKTVFERPKGEFQYEHVFNVNKAFDLSSRKKIHIAEAYAELLHVQLEGSGNQRLKPIYIPEAEIGGTEYSEYVLVSMFSASCTSRDANTKGLPPNKMLPWEKWVPMINLLRASFPDTPIRFIGAPTDMVPNGYAMDIVRPGEYMLGIPLNRLALIMQKTKLVVTIDNGMSHLAASQETPTFLMYPRCLGAHYILPIGNPNLISWVHMDPVTVNTRQLVHSLDYCISKLNSLEVSRG